MNSNAIEFLCTSVIVSPNISEQEFAYEFDQMIRRNWAIGNLIAGRVDLEEYENILEDTGIDPIAFHDDWLERLNNVTDF